MDTYSDDLAQLFEHLDLKGAVMIGRLEQSLDALRDAQIHLNNYLETKVRATN